MGAEFTPGGWSWLLVLLNETQWDRRRAIFVLAGLDPDRTAFYDHVGGVLTTRLVWLPDGCPAAWREMPADRIQRRAERCLAAIETRLYRAPASLPPHLWVYELLRRGLEPAWFRAALQLTGLKALLPPLPNPQGERAKARRAAQRHTAAKDAVRLLWDEWNLGERSFPNKERFVGEALRAVDENADGAELDASLVREWIAAWEAETYSYYGRLPDGERVYGHRAMLLPVKAERPARGGKAQN